MLFSSGCVDNKTIDKEYNVSVENRGEEMINHKPQVVEGEIFFEDVFSSFSGATVYIRLEDVSIADAPAQIVAEKVVRNVSVNVDNLRPLPFSLNSPVLDERAMYSLSAHVDVGNNGIITQGDYITTESYPVKAFQSSVRMTVHVRPVGTLRVGSG